MANDKQQMTNPSQRSNRRGLAPVELVLYLPIMLFVMGLMMIFGASGGWKVRTMANSRQAAWRAFEHRTGNEDAHPEGWPASAIIERRDASPPVVEDDPFADHQVVRGPTLSAGGASLPVKEDTLEMRDGLMAGFAEIERPWPLLKKMKPGKINFPRELQVLDGSRWQYTSMGMGWNLARRVLFTYEFDVTAAPGGQQALQRYVDAALAIIQNPNRDKLIPLEGNDPEPLQCDGTRSPDFQPKIRIGSEPATIVALLDQGQRTLLPTYCQFDPDRIRRDKIFDESRPNRPDRLIPQIRRVPASMKSWYLNYYKGVKSNLEAIPPPRPPGVQQKIADLERKISQLETFQP